MTIPKTVTLKDGCRLHIREGTPRDASEVLHFLECVSGETNFLSFGPGEFDLTLQQEADFLDYSLSADNHVFLLGHVDQLLVTTLHFAGGRRPRIRHSGEFGMSVLKDYWDNGVGTSMLDTLLAWARETYFVHKISLRVRTDNERAIHLYTKQGFKHEGTTLGDVKVDGTYYDHHIMGRRL